MPSATFRRNSVATLRLVTLAPILLAGLIGCIPLLIPCLACRCCKEIIARARTQWFD